jgi:hypothetical protein
MLEKLLAHNEARIRLGHPKAMGIDQADTLAKRAIAGAGHPVWQTSLDLYIYGDAIELLDAGGLVIQNVGEAFPKAWWLRSRQVWAAKPRPKLDILFPVDMDFDWPASNGNFRCV